MSLTPGFVRFGFEKVACEVCGRTGYDGGRWQESCQKGHPYVCPECGKPFSTKQGRANHIRMSKDHQGSEQSSLF